MFLGIHTPAYSLIAQLDPTQRCFHHNSESQQSTWPDVFPARFRMHGPWLPNTRWWKKSLTGFVLVLWGNEHDEEQGEGEMDWLVGARVRSTHSWACSSASFTLRRQHNPPCSFDTTLFQADSPSHEFIFSPQFSSPLPVSTGDYIIRDWIDSLLRGLPVWVSGKLVNWLCMSPLIKQILRFYKGNIMLRIPRCDLSYFLLAKSLKIEDFFFHGMRMSVMLEKEKSKKPFNGL